MPIVTVSYSGGTDVDWVAVHIKPNPNGDFACNPAECTTLDGWTAVQMNNRIGQIALSPGDYFYRYQAGQTANQNMELKMEQPNHPPLVQQPIMLGATKQDVGCNVFKVYP